MGIIFNDESQTDRIDLSRFDDEYDRIAQEGDSGWERIPDGYYDTKVEDVRLGMTQNTGNPMIVWRLRIIGPAHVGGVITKNRVITSKTLPYLRRDLETFGIQLERFSTLEARLVEMTGREVPVMKKTSPDGWGDTMFLRRKIAASATLDSGYSARAVNDDVPF